MLPPGLLPHQQVQETLVVFKLRLLRHRAGKPDAWAAVPRQVARLGVLGGGGAAVLGDGGQAHEAERNAPNDPSTLAIPPFLGRDAHITI